MLKSVKGKKSRVPSQEYPEYPESRVSRVSRVSLKNPQEENPRFHEVNAIVSESERSAVVKTNSVFYSVFVVMWRQCDVAFLSTFILLLFLRIYQNLSTNFPSLFLLNITTQGVRHHSPLTTSWSLPFVRWTREGLLARRSVHFLIRTGVPDSLDPFSLAISLIIPNLHCSVPTFAWAYYTLILTNLALYKH